MKQSAMSPRTGRIIELDIAKGLGILSMILYNALPASPLHTALGGYMMPLFFVVSGLVMQRDACSFSLRRFWEKNARLLFYYILFSAIYLLCSVVTCIAGHGSYKALALDGIATLVGCGFNVLWFLSTLFFGKLLCSLLTGSTLPRWAQGLFLAGLFLLAAGVGRAVDFTVLTGVGRVLGMVGLTVLRPMEAAFYRYPAARCVSFFAKAVYQAGDGCRLRHWRHCADRRLWLAGAGSATGYVRFDCLSPAAEFGGGCTGLRRHPRYQPGAGQGAYAEQRSRLLGRTRSVPDGHSQPAQFIWLAQQAICQAVRRVARLVYAGHVLSPAHRGGADNRHGTGAATGSGSARLGSPLHRTEKRSDKPGALLTFRSRFAMIPR